MLPGLRTLRLFLYLQCLEDEEEPEAIKLHEPCSEIAEDDLMLERGR